MNLYQEELIEHFKNPHNYGTIENPDFYAEDHNPSCGDHVRMEGKFLKAGLLLKFTGKGCVLSQATASMLTEKFSGKELACALSFSRDDIVNMVGLQLGPVRVKCAMLPLLVLQSGIKKVKHDQN